MSKPKKTVTVKFAVYTYNCGDGSARPKFFPTVELAEAAAERDDERYCEDVQEHEFQVNPDTGEIVSGLESVSEDWGV